jgi:3-isopropylmalate dehydrogenase
MSVFRIAILPGDGIGEEVVAEGLKVLRCVEQRFNVRFETEEALVGWAAIDATGTALPPATVELCRSSDAIYFGAVGDPARDATLPPRERPEPVALLGLRKGLFANLRPVILSPSLVDASPLKREVLGNGIDILIVRELTGGLYYGQPKGREPLQPLESASQIQNPNAQRAPEIQNWKAVDTMVYTSEEIRRIARVGFEAARTRRKKLCSVDKANILATSQLWREVVTDLGQEYPDIELSHLYVDNCAMQLIRNPSAFDVIVTENTFGDILSDEASMLAGSLGMLPSACLGDGSATPFYEPIHGSAPDITGKGIANPLASILTAAMMLRHSFQMEEAAAAIDRAVDQTLRDGYRTADIMQAGGTQVSTSEMGDRVVERVE